MILNPGPRLRANSQSYGTLDEDSAQQEGGVANQGYVTDQDDGGGGGGGRKSKGQSTSSSHPDDAVDNKSIAPSTADSEAVLVPTSSDGSNGASPSAQKGSGDGGGRSGGAGGKGLLGDLPQEAWWRMVLELSGPFLLAGLGMAGAGYVLGEVQV